MVHEGFGTGDNLWVELDWVQGRHEALAGGTGEMGILYQGPLGIHVSVSRQGVVGGQQSHPEGRGWLRAPRFLTNLLPSGSRDLWDRN